MTEQIHGYPQTADSTHSTGDSPKFTYDFSRLYGGVWDIHPPKYKAFLWHLKQAMTIVRQGGEDDENRFNSFMEEHKDIDTFLSQVIPSHGGKNTYQVMSDHMADERAHPTRRQSPIVLLEGVEASIPAVAKK